MMNVLDALRYRLGGASDEQGVDPGILEMMGDRGFGMRPKPPQLPPGLPLVVRDSILNQPSYAEGDVKAPWQWWNPAMEAEENLGGGPRRDEALSQGMAGARNTIATQASMPVLDMLRSRLGGSGQSDDRVVEDMVRGSSSEADRRLQAMGQNLPEYLPEQVWNSILNKPMYDEGTRIPGPHNPLMEQEAAAGVFGGPQRDQQLPFNRFEALGLANPRSDPWDDLSSRAVPEGGMWSSRPPGQSPFASPLNQLMQLGRRAPLSMY